MSFQLYGGFDRLRECLVDSGTITPEEFSNLETRFQRYEQARLRHIEKGWPALSPIALVESLMPLLGPHKFFEAWAAWHSKPFTSIERLCEGVKAQFGESFFSGRALDPLPPAGMQLGQTLIAMGCLDDDTLQEELAMQKEIERLAGTRLLLGVLLVGGMKITLGEYYQALAIHFGLPFTGVNDATLFGIYRKWQEKAQRG